jgi:hypothetical protein
MFGYSQTAYKKHLCKGAEMVIDTLLYFIQLLGPFSHFHDNKMWSKKLFVARRNEVTQRDINHYNISRQGMLWNNIEHSMLYERLSLKFIERNCPIK